MALFCGLKNTHIFLPLSLFKKCVFCDCFLGSFCDLSASACKKLSNFSSNFLHIFCNFFDTFLHIFCTFLQKNLDILPTFFNKNLKTFTKTYQKFPEKIPKTFQNFSKNFCQKNFRQFSPEKADPFSRKVFFYRQ